MAHKKQAAAQERPRFRIKRLGVKVFGGQTINAGGIIIRQRVPGASRCQRRLR